MALELQHDGLLQAAAIDADRRTNNARRFPESAKDCLGPDAYKQQVSDLCP
jgi:hypothetical protein